MTSLTANPIVTHGALPLVRGVSTQGRHIENSSFQFNSLRTKIDSLKFTPLAMRSPLFHKGQAISVSIQRKSASVICAAALNARCGAEQTQTVTRESSTITVAPVQGKEKSPDLDDGGDGFPPRDDGDGGGGGGGGGGWSGGFFFFGFLAFLGLLRDKESESPYQD